MDVGASDEDVLGRLGALDVRLARGADEVAFAQELRHRVFRDGPGRDADAFDAVCDHLLVRDRAEPGGPVVATYRLLRREVAEGSGGFYSADEFDLAPLLDARPRLRLLELGRSCVLTPYRTGRAVELLWHGAWAYVLRHRIDVMFGCASLPGTDPEALAPALAFLHHHARAEVPWPVRAVPGRRVAMDAMPAGAIEPRAALRALPPLLKGYLRLGAFVGDGAVVDHRFGTTDVLVILPVAGIAPRYVAHFGPTAGRHAA